MSSYGPERGPAGTKVTIRGRNFDDTTRVYYDGRRVRDASVARTSITFEVPARAEDEGDITLRRSGSRSDIVVGAFEVRNRDRGKVRADRGKRRAERERAAKSRWDERRRGMPESIEERRKRLQEEEEKLRRSRDERRRVRAARMRAQFEREFLANPQVRQELSLHSERTARLERMLRLAETDDHGGLVVRIEIQIEREGDRHERRMATLRRQLQ